MCFWYKLSFAECLAEKSKPARVSCKSIDTIIAIGKKIYG